MLTLYFILACPTRKSAAASKKRKQDSDDGEAISPVKKRMRPPIFSGSYEDVSAVSTARTGIETYTCGEVLRQVLATSNSLKTWLYVTDFNKYIRYVKLFCYIKP